MKVLQKYINDGYRLLGSSETSRENDIFIPNEDIRIRKVRPYPGKAGFRLADKGERIAPLWLNAEKPVSDYFIGKIISKDQTIDTTWCWLVPWPQDPRLQVRAILPDGTDCRLGWAKSYIHPRTKPKPVTIYGPGTHMEWEDF